MCFVSGYFTIFVILRVTLKLNKVVVFAPSLKVRMINIKIPVYAMLSSLTG